MSEDALLECIPNFSEGSDAGKVQAIVSAMHVEGVRLLDWSMDADHNRSVVTLAGHPAAVMEAALRGAGEAARLIDLRVQHGVHPRIGATDVIPFTPISGISLDQCALYARRTGEELWKRYQIPVYFYGAASSRPDRVELEDVRRGQFEGLRELAIHDPGRRPDIGGPGLHPSAGATALGARKYLVAYNLHLDKPNIGVARAVARAIRASGGGLAGVKAMGVMVKGRAQISMNITDLDGVTMGEVFQKASLLAAAQGARIADGELIGLLPQQAYEPESDWVRLLVGFKPAEKILETRLDSPLAWPGEEMPIAEEKSS